MRREGGEREGIVKERIGPKFLSFSLCVRKTMISSLKKYGEMVESHFHIFVISLMKSQSPK
jgi:hypothetical protein